MAKEYDLCMYGHPSIYKPKERKLKIYFSEPESGVNENTGILLLIPGFGGNANSNVYKKMRDYFSDEYNLVVVQCDYFGWEFMQAPNNVSINLNKEELLKVFSQKEIDYIFKDKEFLNRLIEVANKYSYNILCNEVLDENLTNFNDMGIMQALDNISAVIIMIEIIKDNGYKFDEGKIIIYGHSHGAYLAYLCNAFAPNLFSMIIDNSAWIFPVYLESNRYVNTVYGNTILSCQFDYLAKSIDYDKEILYLPSLYKKFNNICNIICYHGTDDSLININDKEKFAKCVNRLFLNKISSSKVDGKIFKSTQHGLGADFIKMFELTMKNNGEFKKDKNISLSNILYETNKKKYYFDYSNIVPNLRVE